MALEHQARRHIRKVFGQKKRDFPIPILPTKPTPSNSAQDPGATPPVGKPPVNSSPASTPAPSAAHTTEKPVDTPPPVQTTPSSTKEAAPTTTTSSSSTTTSSTSSSTTSTSTTSTSSTVVTTTSTSTSSTTPTTLGYQFGTNTDSLTSALPTSAGGNSTISDNSNASGASSSSSVNAGAIVGGITGALFGVALLVFIFGFIRRRMRKSARDRWNRDSFIRDSMMLPADALDAHMQHDPMPAMGTRNALALAQANMAYENNTHAGGYNDYNGGVAQPEMTYAPGSHLPAHYGADVGYGAAAGAGGAYYEQQPAADGYYDYNNNHNQSQVMFSAGAGQQQFSPTVHGGQYDDLARAIEVPAVAVTHHEDAYHNGGHSAQGRTSPPGTRQLDTTYGTERSGTPTQSNVQEAHFDLPADKRSAGHGYDDDAYGGM